MLKKVLSLLCVATLLVGCSGGTQSEKEDPEDSMTCVKDEDLGEGITMSTNIEYKYRDKTATKQIQNVVITLTDKAYYDAMVKMLEDEDASEEYGSYDGVTYELIKDDEAMTITEKMTIDFSVISGDDYKAVTNDEAETSGSKALIDIDLTKEGFETDGFACSYAEKIS